jgi:hypothetical protein
MGHAQADAQGLRAGDLSVEVLDEDVVVAAGVHLGEANLLPPGTHGVDVHQLGILAVEAALNDFLAYNKEGALQYPANLPKVNAARVYRLGDYVFYILLAAVPDEYMDNEEGAFDFAVESNESVVKKINEILAK